jgi:hypothetical protein
VAAVSNSVAATGLSVHVQPAQATPSKKVLEAVLEKLKKKDTYGVFSEPVDSSLVCSLPPPHAVLILVPTLFCFWACFIMQVI